MVYSVSVDRDLCIQCLVAPSVCPEVFFMGEDNGKNRLLEKYSEETSENLSRGLVPDELFEEMIGVSRKDIKLELSKVMKQDEDLSAKNQALKLASQITGLTDTEGVRIQVNQMAVDKFGLSD